MKIGLQTRLFGAEMIRNCLDDVLAQAAAAGYAGIEIGAQHLDISRPEVLRDLLAKHGLQPVAIHMGGEIYDPDSVRQALANTERNIAYAAGAGAAFLAYSGQMSRESTEDTFAREAEGLNDIGRLCRQHGVRLCYHNHFWELQDNYRELQYLCDHTEPELVSLCLDIGWVQRTTGDPAAACRTFLPRIGYLHLKDTTTERWTEFGAGDVDFAGVFAAIAGAELPWLVVEQDETDRTPADSASMSRTFLRDRFGV